LIINLPARGERRHKRMYDTGKIITGLMVFILLCTLMVYYYMFTGKASAIPEPEIITKEKQCIEAAPYMKEYHMQFLDNWREKVVRESTTLYEGAGGKTYTISLTKTCLECHSNKEKFCDKCHNYVGVTPNCWNCHFWKPSKYSWPEPGEEEKR
jgi:hypothetical protein